VANPQWESIKDPGKDCSYFPLRWQSCSATVAEMSLDPQVPSCAPLGGMSAVFLGHQSGDILLESLRNEIVLHHKPDRMPCNLEMLYFSHYSLFESSGERWDDWDTAIRRLLCQNQHTQEDCQQGSWDASTGFPHVLQSGRLLSTAFACLCLQVVNRWGRIGQKPRQNPRIAIP
jgi:hypothetical protein